MSNFDPIYIDLFGQPTIDDYLESLRAKGLQYRAKIIESGGMLELVIYPINPVWKKRKGEKRPKPKKATRKAQRDLNDKNTRKHVSRLIHANFCNKDIWVTFTYDPDMYMPENVAEAVKQLKNYFARLRRHIEKHSLPELKYIYVTERVKNEDTGKVHTHHHVIMNFRDRDIAELLWNLGGRTQSRWLQPDTDGSLEGLARYITKPETKAGNRKGAKSYATSKNLKKPTVDRSNYRMPRTGYRLSKKRVAEMATNENKANELIAQHYSNYALVEPIVVQFSDYIAGAYIYARMMRKPTNEGRGNRHERRRNL